MKIKYIQGDVTEATQLIIGHGCNAQGKMNSGVAKAIRTKFPAAYRAYKEAHDRGDLEVGSNVVAVEGEFDSDQYKIVFNMITQEYYGHDGKQYCDYDAIRSCLKYLNELAEALGETEIALPKIGAGLGGGDWNIISKIIEEESITFQPIIYFL